MSERLNKTYRRRRGHLFLKVIAPVAVLIITTTGVFGQGQSKPPAEQPKEDGQELGERLIREAAGGNDEGVMDRIVRLMKTSSRHLIIEFDVGKKTQAIQRDIVENLDAAIKKAAAQRRPFRSRDRSQRSDKRRKSQMASRDQKSGREKGSSEGRGENSGSATADASARADSARGGRLFETRRSWGHLPQRDREEFIQGIGEGFLDRYREWIERYYRALQEEDN